MEADHETEIVETIENFCCNCTHLLGKRVNPEDACKWKCVHPNNMVKNEQRINLVTGIQEYIRDYKQEDIQLLREASGPCGPEGRWFEAYKKPEYQAPPIMPTIGGKQPFEIEAPFSQEQIDSNAIAARERLAAIKAKRLKV